MEILHFKIQLCCVRRCAKGTSFLLKRFLPSSVRISDLRNERMNRVLFLYSDGSSGHLEKQIQLLISWLYQGMSSLSQLNLNIKVLRLLLAD